METSNTLLVMLSSSLVWLLLELLLLPTSLSSLLVRSVPLMFRFFLLLGGKVGERWDDAGDDDSNDANSASEGTCGFGDSVTGSTGAESMSMSTTTSPDRRFSSDPESSPTYNHLECRWLSA